MRIIPNLFQLILLLFIFSCSVNKEREYAGILNTIHDQYPMYVCISPNGNKILIKSRIEETFELLTLDIRLNEVDTINRSNFTQLSLTWHPNEREILFQELNPNTRMYELYKVDLFSKQRILIGLPASNNAIPPLRLSKNGFFLAYLASGRKMNLYIYDFNKNKINNSFPNLNSYSEFQWSGDSIFFFIENPRNPILKQANIQTGEISEYVLIEFEEIKNFSINKEKVLFVGQEPNTEYFQCYELNLENMNIKKLNNTDFNISNCRYSNNKSIFFYNQYFNLLLLICIM